MSIDHQVRRFRVLFYCWQFGHVSIRVPQHASVESLEKTIILDPNSHLFTYSKTLPPFSIELCWLFYSELILLSFPSRVKVSAVAHLIPFDLSIWLFQRLMLFVFFLWFFFHCLFWSIPYLGHILIPFLSNVQDILISYVLRAYGCNFETPHNLPL